MIGLRHLRAGDESCMTGDCCQPEGSIHRCVRTHSHLYSHIYMPLWLSYIINNQASRASLFQQ
jgi:hypothetical protein